MAQDDQRLSAMLKDSVVLVFQENPMARGDAERAVVSVVTTGKPPRAAKLACLSAMDHMVKQRAAAAMREGR